MGSPGALPKRRAGRSDRQTEVRDPSRQYDPEGSGLGWPGSALALMDGDGLAGRGRGQPGGRASASPGGALLQAGSQTLEELPEVQ